MVALLWLTACGGREEAQALPPNDSPTENDAPAATQPPVAAVGEGVTAIQVAVVADDFAVGTPRVPFVLYESPNQVSNAQKVKVTLFDLTQDPPAPGWFDWATNYSDYAVPYWIVRPEIPQAGNWGLIAQIIQADGMQTDTQFVIEVLETPRYPSIGDTPPSSENRTLATEPDIKKLTSAFDPNPAFYQMTVKEAVANEQPTVVVFSTPGFCQTAVCAPVLESIEEAFDTYGDRTNFIHLEVYKQFNPELIVADEMVEWGLMTEPWTYVLDNDGRVAARFGGPVSPRELAVPLVPLLH